MSLYAGCSQIHRPLHLPTDAGLRTLFYIPSVSSGMQGTCVGNLYKRVRHAANDLHMSVAEVMVCKKIRVDSLFVSAPTSICTVTRIVLQTGCKLGLPKGVVEDMDHTAGIKIDEHGNKVPKRRLLPLI